MRLRTILVVAVLVLAGCSGFGGGLDETPTDGPEPTATITETSTDEAGATDGSTDGSGTEGDSAEASPYPAGVSEAGLENLSGLLTAQQATLSDSAHVTEYWLNATTQRDGETLEQRTHTLERVTDDGVLAYTANRSGTTSGTRAVSIYGNDSIGLSKQVTQSQFENQTRYTRAISGSHLQRRQGGSFFTIYVAFGEYTTTDVTESGESTRITLEATERNETFTSELDTNITSYQGTLVVDGDGVIHSADIAMTTNDSQGEVDYAIDFDQSIGGDVTVSRPSWYDTALQQTADVTLSATTNDSAIELTNTGSDPIESGQAILLTKNGSGNAFVELQQSIDAGETVALYRDAETGRLQVAATQPSDAAGFAGTYQVELTNGTITVARTTVAFE